MASDHMTRLVNAYGQQEANAAYIDETNTTAASAIAATEAIAARDALLAAITDLETERARLKRKVRGLQLTVSDMAEAFGGVPGSLMGEFSLSEHEIADAMTSEPKP